MQPTDGPPLNGAASSWRPFRTVGGCGLERLANGRELRAFEWEPCEATPGCERARFADELQPDPQFTPASMVVEGQQTVVALTGGGGLAVLFLTTDGRYFDGFRSDGSEPTCIVARATSNGELFGFLASSGQGAARGFVLGTLGSAAAPTNFEFDGSLSGAISAVALSGDRWMWTMTPSTRQISANLDGSGLVVLAAPEGPLYDMADVRSAGDVFFYSASLDHGGDQLESRVMTTDGRSEPVPYIAEPGLMTLGFRYAHTHVACQQGVNREPGRVNRFERVEVWGSPYHPDPANLTPSKLGDSRMTTMTTGNGESGGFGRYALIEPDATGARVAAVLVWNIADGSMLRLPVPADAEVDMLLGTTREHVWLLTDNPSGIVRLRIGG